MSEPEAPEPADEPANDTPRVILCTPHYGQVSMGLLHTINGAVRDRSLLTVNLQAQSSSSVLPHCFNELLCVALHARDTAKVTHLAMCHSDILAETGWLDTLWGEMWYHGADLISAVVPIKAMNGRTSTAIGDANDRWKVKRCVYLKDRATLPETFGPEHVCGEGERLLVNTGLFLADLRRPWWDDFAFQFHTRIVKDGDGVRRPECRSEDWEMSHHLADHGARVMATWKVRLRHEGGYKFPSHPEAA